jgi:molybdenum cofactor cytidylyltransferase
VIVGVLLAAGAGTRFGGGKLLALLSDGTPVGVRAGRTLRNCVDRAIAVVRPGDVRLATLLESEGFEVAVSPRADEGMGASLAFGVASSPEAKGWLVALADMPFIHPGTFEAVARTIREGAWIAVPVHLGRRGHPVGFSRPLFPELVRLGGDEGAKSILKLHASRVAAIDRDDPGILEDIDVIGDLSGPGPVNR